MIHNNQLINKIEYYFLLFFTYYANDDYIDSKLFKNIKELKYFIRENKTILFDGNLHLELKIIKTKMKENEYECQPKITKQYLFYANTLYLKKIIEGCKNESRI